MSKNEWSGCPKCGNPLKNTSWGVNWCGNCKRLLKNRKGKFVTHQNDYDNIVTNLRNLSDGSKYPQMITEWQKERNLDYESITIEEAAIKILATTCSCGAHGSPWTIEIRPDMIRIENSLHDRLHRYYDLYIQVASDKIMVYRYHAFLD